MLLQCGPGCVPCEAKPGSHNRSMHKHVAAEINTEDTLSLAPRERLSRSLSYYVASHSSILSETAPP